MRHIIRRTLVAICLASLASFLIRDRLRETKRRTVNVYNWSDYIDPSVIGISPRRPASRCATTRSIPMTCSRRSSRGRSGYDVVAPTAYFLERQIKAGVFARLTRASCRTSPICGRDHAASCAIRPDNLYGVNYMWGTTASATISRVARTLR